MGIEIERFTDEIDKELICSICFGVLENPIQIDECGHAFCKECINGWLNQNMICPNDRREIKEKSIIPASRMLKSILSRLKVKCDFSSLGCNEIILLESLSSHTKLCKFNPEISVPCVNGCGEMVNAKDKVNHNCIRVYVIKVEELTFKLHESENICKEFQSKLIESENSNKELRMQLQEKEKSIEMINKNMENYIQMEKRLKEMDECVQQLAIKLKETITISSTMTSVVSYVVTDTPVTTSNNLFLRSSISASNEILLPNLSQNTSTFSFNAIPKFTITKTPIMSAKETKHINKHRKTPKNNSNNSIDAINSHFVSLSSNNAQSMAFTFPVPSSDGSHHRPNLYENLNNQTPVTSGNVSVPQVFNFGNQNPSPFNTSSLLPQNTNNNK